MSYTAALGDGATISIGHSMGEVKSIKFGGGGYESVDVSNLSTTGLRRYLQTKSADGGEITVEYISAASQTPPDGEVTVDIAWGVSESVSFTAFVMHADCNVPLRQAVAHTLTLKITETTETGAGYDQ